MDKQDKPTKSKPEGVDKTRRDLLGKAGKAAWVTPTLAFLSFTPGSSKANQPPDPPSACLPNCPPRPDSDSGGRAKPERKPGRD